MSIYTKATTYREAFLMSAGIARGNRQALMREARRSEFKSVLVKSARSFNLDVVTNLRRAREK